MQTLHLDLKPVAENYIELRYFVDNPNKYEKRSLCLTEVADLIELAERDYYVSSLPEDYTVTGRRLYNWLDGSDRTLQPLLDKYRREGIVLAIAFFKQSLALKEQIGDVKGKAATLQQLGRLKANSGEIEEAIALYQQSLALNEQIGDVQGKARTLWQLGGVAEQQGDYNQALDYLQPALEILQRIQSPDAEEVRQMVARVQGLISNS